MSNFIPMVSSSPPPLDDGGGFNDWGDEDDDDFGNFTSATDGDFQTFNDNDNSDFKWGSFPDNNNENQNEIPKFADFGNFTASPGESCDTIKENILNDKMKETEGVNESVSNNIKNEEMKGPGLELNLDKPLTAYDKENAQTNDKSPDEQDDVLGENKSFVKSHSENNFNSISSISPGDSGLCSIDISPVPQSDDNYDLCDKSQGSDVDDFGDFQSDSSLGKETSDLQEEVKENDNNDVCKDNIPSAGDAMQENTGVTNISISEENFTNIEGPPEKTGQDKVLSGSDNESSQIDNEGGEQTDDFHSSLHSSRDNVCTSSSDSVNEIQRIEETDRVIEEVGLSSGDTIQQTNIGSDNMSGDSPPSISENSVTIPESEDIKNSQDSNDNEVDVNDIEEQKVAVTSVGEVLDDSDSLKPECDVSSEGQDSNKADIGANDECFAAESDSNTNSKETSDAEDDAFKTKDTNNSSSDAKNSDVESIDQELSKSDLDKSTKQELSKSDLDNSNEQELSKSDPDNSKEQELSNSDTDNSTEQELSKSDPDNSKEQELSKSDPDNSKEQELSKPVDPEDSDEVNDNVSDVTSNIQITVSNEHGKSTETFQNDGSEEKQGNTGEENDDQESDFDIKHDYSGSADLDLPSIKAFSATPSDSQADLSAESAKVGDSSQQEETDNKTEDDLDDMDDFDDFADFQSENNVISSDGNFGDFKSENTSKSDFASVQSPDNDDGGWAAEFKSAGNDNEDNGWATFQSSENEDKKIDNDDDDDMDDFGDFSTSGVQNTLTQTEPHSDIVHEKLEPDSVLSICFPDSEEPNDAQEIPCVLDVQPFKNSEDRKKSPFIWSNLKSSDVSTRLARLWSDSRGNKVLFQALRIDTRNILLGHRKPSVPVYASNLTLLEPTKGPAPSEVKPETKLVDTTKPEEKSTRSQDLPPVQFDWTNSGLTNPLEANNKTLELDFLVVKEAEAASKNGVFDSEIMHGRDPAKAGMQPLQNILANLKTNSTMKKTRQTENLTKEATKVLGQLPTLSFMQAKVLMFPFKEGGITEK